MPQEKRAKAGGPRWAIWELTLACDQKCSHCGPRAGVRRPNELSTEECLQIVRELRDLGAGEVVLIGGEAYLRNDFILIIRAIREAGMSCTMTTGGLNISRERAEAMIEAGISSVTFSIDGMEETHDRLRGIPKSWQRAFQGLENIRTAGGQVACLFHDRSRKVDEAISGYRPALTLWHARYLCRSWALEHALEVPARVELSRLATPFPPMTKLDADAYFWTNAKETSLVRIRCTDEPFAQIQPELRLRRGLPEARPGELQVAWPKKRNSDSNAPLWSLLGLALLGVGLAWSAQERRSPSRT